MDYDDLDELRCGTWLDQSMRQVGQKGGVAGRAHTGAGDEPGFLWQVFKGSCERGGLEEQEGGAE